jgi:hypothetical protein
MFAGTLAAVACLLSAACSTTTIESQTKAQAANQGRIYFLRGSNFVGMANAPHILVNDQEVGTLGNNSYLFVDRDPGSYKVSVEVPFSLGHYVINVPVRAGSVAYVAVAPRMSAAAAVAVGGLVGGIVEAAASGEEKAGSYSLTLLDQAAGVALLQELKK